MPFVDFFLWHNPILSTFWPLIMRKIVRQIRYRWLKKTNRSLKSRSLFCWVPTPIKKESELPTYSFSIVYEDRSSQWYQNCNNNKFTLGRPDNVRVYFFSSRHSRLGMKRTRIAQLSLRAKVDCKSAFSKGWVGQFGAKFQVEGEPIDHSSCRKTRMMDLLRGVKWVSFVSSQFRRLTDGQTDGRTFHSWLRCCGKNCQSETGETGRHICYGTLDLWPKTLRVILVFPSDWDIEAAQQTLWGRVHISQIGGVRSILDACSKCYESWNWWQQSRFVPPPQA